MPINLDINYLNFISIHILSNQAWPSLLLDRLIGYQRINSYLLVISNNSIV